MGKEALNKEKQIKERLEKVKRLKAILEPTQDERNELIKSVEDLSVSIDSISKNPQISLGINQGILVEARKQVIVSNGIEKNFTFTGIGRLTTKNMLFLDDKPDTILSEG